MLSAALRMVHRRLSYSMYGLKKYKGTPQQMTHSIIESCWSGSYFMTSSGHFKDFYIRDFAMCMPALINLGYQQKAIQTITYALETYAKNNKVASAISPEQKCFDFFKITAVDTLPFLIHCLVLAHQIDKKNSLLIITKHKTFLEQEVKLYAQLFDLKTGLLKKQSRVSSLKDHYIRTQSCYAHCVAGMLSADLTTLKLANPFKKIDYAKLLLQHFYNGVYFKETLHSNIISGDANTFPFYCNIIHSKDIFETCITAIQQEGLDRPFPLKYTKHIPAKKYTHSLLKHLAPNYEGNSIWIHLGLCYLYTTLQFDKKRTRQYIQNYTIQFKKYNNFLELFTKKKKPYKSLFYVTDDSMLWAAMYLDIAKKANAI